MFLNALKTIFAKLKQQPLFYIIVIICAANWQLLFGINSMQWDVTNFWAPWRYYISECYNNGHIPLWDPYAQAGYPVHGDLQGPGYCPEAIISSFLFPVSLYFLNILFIGYLVLGAYGFYKLSTFILSKVKLKDGSALDNSMFMYVNLLSGLIYGLSGYNVGYGHYLYITISMALLPWIYYYFFKLFDKGTFKDAIKFALFLFWQITAGNPSFLIMTGYFFVVLAAIRFVYLFRNKRKPEIFHFIKMVSGAFILLVILSLPIFINAFFVFPDTSRFGGMDVNFAGEENFVFKNFFTFFTSLIAFERDLKLGNDGPIFSHYIGLFAILFSIIGFIKFKSFWLRAFLVIAILAMFLSFGLTTPVYPFLYKHLPFVNVFRMPRLIFLHTLIFMLLLFSCGLAYYLNRGIKLKQVVIYIGTVLVVSVCSLLFFKFIYQEQKTGYVVDHSTLRAFLWSSSESKKAFISLVINIVLVIVAFNFFKKGQTKYVLALLLFDVVLNYNLGAICRNFSEDKLKFTDSYIHKLPEGFPVPANIPAKKIDMLTSHYNEFWKNIPIYLKQPYYGNDNSFELTRYMELFDHDREQYDYLLSCPHAFFVDSLTNTFDKTSTPFTAKKTVVVYSRFFDELSKIKLKSNTQDKITCTLFDPEKINYTVENKDSIGFVTQQNFTNRWDVTINGKPVVRVDYCFHSFPLLIVPPGKNRIEFTYNVPGFGITFFVSLALFVVLMIVLIITIKNKRIKFGTLALFLFVVVFCSFKFIKGKSKTIQSSYASAIAEFIDVAGKKGANGPLIVNGQDEIKQYLKPEMFYANLLFREDLAELCEKLRNTSTSRISYLRYGAYHSQEAEALIRLYFGKPVYNEKLDFGEITIYEKEPQTSFLKYENTLDVKTTECGDCKTTDSLGVARLRIDKAHEFSPGFAFTLEEAKADKYDIIEASCDIETEFPDFIGLCISIEKDGNIKKFLAYNYVHYPNKKDQKISLAYRLPASLKKDMQVKVYVWNNSEKPLYLKALKVKVLDDAILK